MRNVLKSHKNILLFILFIIILSYFLYKNKLKEGMSYNDAVPEIKYYYQDYDGIDIADIYNYGKCLIIQDEIQLCDKKEFIYHDMITHFPIQYLKNYLKNVLIIGGGDLMTLREIMKYESVENVIMLELSPDIVNLCEKYFNQSKFDEDSRVQIIYGDANITINKLFEDYEEEIDLIIVDTTEDNDSNSPVDTIEFFKKCIRLLQPNGILVKNGLRFTTLFEDIKNTNLISYSANIPYFQENYFFSILSLKNNDIKDINIDKNKWEEYNIDCKFYKKRKHNKYLIHDYYLEKARY